MVLHAQSSKKLMVAQANPDWYHSGQILINSVTYEETK